jgi:hypothetical protein
MPERRPLSTAILIVCASVVASYFAVAFDRQENRAETPPAPEEESPSVPTITSDEFVAQVAAAVADELDLPEADEGRIVDILTDDNQPGVIIVPPTTTTTTTSTTTTTTEPRPPPTTAAPRPLIDPNEVLDQLHPVP